MLLGDLHIQSARPSFSFVWSGCRKSSKRISLFSRESGPKAKGSIKYSGAKLHEKGVILEIEGLPINQ